MKYTDSHVVEDGVSLGTTGICVEVWFPSDPLSAGKADSMDDPIVKRAVVFTACSTSGQNRKEKENIFIKKICI